MSSNSSVSQPVETSTSNSSNNTVTAIGNATQPVATTETLAGVDMASVEFADTTILASQVTDYVIAKIESASSGDPRYNDLVKAAASLKDSNNQAGIARELEQMIGAPGNSSRQANFRKLVAQIDAEWSPEAIRQMVGGLPPSDSKTKTCAWPFKGHVC